MYYRCLLEPVGNKWSEYPKIYSGRTLGYIVDAPQSLKSSGSNLLYLIDLCKFMISIEGTKKSLGWAGGWKLNSNNISGFPK